MFFSFLLLVNLFSCDFFWVGYVDRKNGKFLKLFCKFFLVLILVSVIKCSFFKCLEMAIFNWYFLFFTFTKKNFFCYMFELLHFKDLTFELSIFFVQSIRDSFFSFFLFALEF